MKDWIPVISALVSAGVTGGIFKLLWELRAAETRALQAEKDKEIALLKAESQIVISSKEQETRSLIEQYEDRIRDLSHEKEMEIRQQKLEIKFLQSEIARLKLESPQSLGESYEILRRSLLQVHDDLRAKLKEAEIELESKNEELQSLYQEVNRSRELIERTIVQKEEIENRMLQVHDDLRAKLKEAEIKLESKNEELQSLYRQVNRSRELIERTTAQKEELENRIKIFENYLRTLQVFKQRMQLYQTASTWLNTNRLELSQSACFFVIENHPDLIEKSVTDYDQCLEQFQIDIDDYIDWMRFSLSQGKPIPLNDVNIKPALPGFAYAEAFDFIKKKRASQELPEEVANELGEFITNLINFFSSM